MLERLTKQIPKPPKQNKTLQAARKKIILQAIIAFQTIIIAVALIFGMSAAWYTNVLQTSGLQFEAEAWGFTGEILIADEPVRAKPGQSGIIGMTVSNDSDEMIDIAVRVSKAQMVDDMQQRLFFYVDTSATRNNEIMDRVYINAQDSYTYTILSQSELLLTEEQANDVPLKWQWVYDMEGYYFLGTVNEQTNENDETTVVAQVEDYLRPVEYNLDKATFEEGLLATVDGEPAADFLAELSQKDGYEQDITPTDMAGYYEVDVDENGRGVWVYLCNWAEIQQATTYDSQLGMKAAAALEGNTVPEQYIARLMVVGQLKRSEYTNVNTPEHLLDQLNNGSMVRLQRDIVLTEPLTVSSGKKVVLDLNGYSIQAPAGSSALNLTNATNLILLNGELQSMDKTQNVVIVNGSMLTMSNVDILGELKYGVYISDESSIADTCVRLFDCEISAATGAVHVRGNGAESDGRTQVIIDNCVLTSDYITILGNGTKTYWGTDIQITNSTLKGYYAAVYQPQGDSLTRIKNCTLIGGTGIVMKGGDLEITDSTIEGIFTANQVQDPAYNNNGFSDTGDALYVDCSYGAPMNILIEGSSVLKKENANSQSVRVFVPEDGVNSASVSVTGGKFDNSVANYVAPGYEYDMSTNTVVPKPVVEEESDAG